LFNRAALDAIGVRPRSCSFTNELLDRARAAGRMGNFYQADSSRRHTGAHAKPAVGHHAFYYRRNLLLFLLRYAPVAEVVRWSRTTLRCADLLGAAPDWRTPGVPGAWDLAMHAIEGAALSGDLLSAINLTCGSPTGTGDDHARPHRPDGQHRGNERRGAACRAEWPDARCVC
jgi:hypothetical protein